MNALSPLGWVYGLGSELRNKLFDWRILRSHSLGARSISIGNISVGGTGKTPLVAHVAELLSAAGECVCVLTRGHGRVNVSEQVVVSNGKTVLADARRGGDEPVELAMKLVGKAAVVANRDRVAAAKWAVEPLQTTAFVLDDGFQHRRAARDLDIVCVDATDPFGNGEMLPAGRLRERVANLRRAGAVVITRADLAADVENIENSIRRLAPDAKLFRSYYELIGFNDLSGFLAGDKSNILTTIDVPAFTFGGLGNPGGFFRQLERAGVKLTGTRAFPDHHYFTDDDIREIEKRASEAGAEVLITTAKDAVRLSEFRTTIPCYVSEIIVRINDEDGFRELIFSS